MVGFEDYPKNFEGFIKIFVTEIVCIDYSTVSVSKKRLRNKIQKENDLKRFLSRIEVKLSKFLR